MRLQGIAEKILPESQSGLRPNKGTTDMIFSVRQRQEKYMEQNKPLYLAFIDLTKAFDTVPRELLWDVLINAKKTQVLFQPSPKDTVKTPPSTKIGETVLENVDKFTYLGSTLSPHANVYAEVNPRLQQAAAAFGKLQSTVFQDRDIRLDAKIKVYKAIVVTTLLCGSETWTIYRRHIAA
ncbi:uncharacterized protein LOC111346749 [Stylophora pistillata]|uniref:uncharacterized protein LOC111346749 n=1 Tax=Stylophora pistillata TaxID=50429 RepID=UPI000C0571EF|nr:uncharacterized protein LOC111346749 [Stylophora pistillata]